MSTSCIHSKVQELKPLTRIKRKSCHFHVRGLCIDGDGFVLSSQFSFSASFLLKIWGGHTRNKSPLFLFLIGELVLSLLIFCFQLLDFFGPFVCGLGSSDFVFLHLLAKLLLHLLAHLVQLLIRILFLLFHLFELLVSDRSSDFWKNFSLEFLHTGKKVC